MPAVQKFVWVLFQIIKIIVIHPTLSLDWEFTFQGARATARVMLQIAVRQTTETRILKSWDIFWSVKATH